MKTYLSMLRGINVAGQKKVPMADLKKLYEALDFSDVITYIQSGNVIFKTNEKANKLVAKIEQKIKDHFGFDVPVIIKQEKDIQQTLSENPFLTEKDVQENKLYVSFLYDIPQPELIEKISSFQTAADRFSIIGNTVYLYCPDGYGNTKLSNNFFENKLKVKATTRNWRSVNELLKLMQG